LMMSVGHKEVAAVLKEHGAGKEPATLYEAAFLGDRAEVGRFLDTGTDIDAKDTSGLTPLMGALLGFATNVVGFLIEKGADVNARGVYGITPLIVAAMVGETEAASALLDRGADVNAKDERSFTPLTAAVFYDRLGMVNLLLDRGADANLNIGGSTPLMFALSDEHPHRGNPEIVKALLNKGAHVNAKDVSGYTPLKRALEAEYKDIADLLRQHGAKE